MSLSSTKTVRSFSFKLMSNHVFPIVNLWRCFLYPNTLHLLLNFILIALGQCSSLKIFLIISFIVQKLFSLAEKTEPEEKFTLPSFFFQFWPIYFTVRYLFSLYSFKKYHLFLLLLFLTLPASVHSESLNTWLFFFLNKTVSSSYVNLLSQMF